MNQQTLAQKWTLYVLRRVLTVEEKMRKVDERRRANEEHLRILADVRRQRSATYVSRRRSMRATLQPSLTFAKVARRTFVTHAALVAEVRNLVAPLLQALRHRRANFQSFSDWNSREMTALYATRCHPSFIIVMRFLTVFDTKETASSAGRRGASGSRYGSAARTRSRSM